MKALDSSSCARLCDLLGRPQRRLRFVHIAGSKGKGTVATLVGAGLDAAGYRVCVITSPHVDSLAERVLVGRGLQRINEDELASHLEVVLAAAEAAPKLAVTWFDVLIAASLYAASHNKCDWAVVECGLGGRTDSTNFIGAEIAALTSACWNTARRRETL